jgi:hypothetical protein
LQSESGCKRFGVVHQCPIKRSAAWKLRSLPVNHDLDNHLNHRWAAQANHNANADQSVFETLLSLKTNCYRNLALRDEPGVFVRSFDNYAS